MKTTIQVLTSILVLLVIIASTLGAQQSDRAIVSKYEQSIKALTLMVDSAKGVQDCADIIATISELEKENTPHKDLLNKALYPDNFETTLMNLRGRLMVRQKDLGVIETQFARIVELEGQVRELSGKVDSLSTQNEKLMSSAKQLSASVAASRATVETNRALFDSLNNIISQLRQNLKERDNLIFSLLDSLFMQYDKNVASMNDVEKRGVYGKLERRNVLTNIKKSITDNLQFLETTTLTPKDYAEIARQQNRFASQWKGFGPKLANIYLTGKQKKNEVALIDSMLSTWTAKVNQGTWKSIAVLFEKNGIALSAFSNGDEFCKSFSDFADSQIKNTNQEAKDVLSKRYNNFNDNVWKTDLEPNWLPVLVESGKITADQKADLEKKVDAWQSAVTPISWVVYAVIGIVIIGIVWVLAKYIRKKPALKA